MSITMQDAIKTAKEFVVTAFADDDVQDVSLEEVARSDDEKHWLVTIGFSVPRKPTERAALLSQILISGKDALTKAIALERVLKRVYVDSTSGKVTAMRIR